MRRVGRRLRLIGLMALLALSMAGCFRPAGDAIEPTAGDISVQPTSIPVDSPTDLPASDGVTADAPAMNPFDTTSTANAMLAQMTPTVGGTIDVLLDTPSAFPVPADATVTPDMQILNIQTVAAETALAGGGGASVPASPTPDANTNADAITPQIITATAVYITPGAPQVPVTLPTALALPTDVVIDDNSPSGDGAPSADATSVPGSIVSDADGCYYIVEAGDSLYGIAINNGLALDELRAANSDVNPQALQIGQRLLLPSCDSATNAPSLPNATLPPGVVPSATFQPSATPIIEGVAYTVQPGDTVSAIASRFNVTINAIVRANTSLQGNPNLLRVGQTLIIPVPATATLPSTPTRAASLPVGSPIEPVGGATATAGG